MTNPLQVPEASFGGDQFWARLNRLADDRGHEGHTRWLVGDTDPDNLVPTVRRIDRGADGRPVTVALR